MPPSLAYGRPTTGSSPRSPGNDRTDRRPSKSPVRSACYRPATPRNPERHGAGPVRALVADRSPPPRSSRAPLPLARQAPPETDAVRPTADGADAVGLAVCPSGDRGPPDSQTFERRPESGGVESVTREGLGSPGPRPLLVESWAEGDGRRERAGPLRDVLAGSNGRTIRREHEETQDGVGGSARPRRGSAVLRLRSFLSRAPATSRGELTQSGRGRPLVRPRPQRGVGVPE